MENEYIESSASIEDAYSKSKKEKKVEKKSKKPKKVQTTLLFQLINGEILKKDFVVNNLPFIFFIILMLLLIVSKVYYGKQLVQEIDVAQKKLNAISAEYVESKAKLEEKTKRYELVRILSPIGLKETTKPVNVIRVKK